MPTSTHANFNSETPQSVVVEHNVNSNTGSGSRSAGLVLGMTKPALAIAGLLVLGGAGAAVFGWFQIPGLNSKIEELQEQISKLSEEVDRLSSENDRYEALNDELNQTAAEFRYLNEELNTTVIELTEISDQLNSTNLALSYRVDELAEENAKYSQQNDELNATAIQLSNEVDFFEAALAKLVLENGALSNTTEALQEVEEEMGSLTEAQNQTLIEMAQILGNLTAENHRLGSLNNEYVSVISFLNDTSAGLDDSLQQITHFLADQIADNKVLLSETLENTFRQQVQNWDCDYRDQFREELFGEDYDVVITNLTAAIEYIDDRVLSGLCLDASDFEEYLLEVYLDGVTSRRLVEGVNTYTADALNFYFPVSSSSAVGISVEEWFEANYSCRNLQSTYPPDITI